MRVSALHASSSSRTASSGVILTKRVLHVLLPCRGRHTAPSSSSDRGLRLVASAYETFSLLQIGLENMPQCWRHDRRDRVERRASCRQGRLVSGPSRPGHCLCPYRLFIGLRRARNRTRLKSPLSCPGRPLFFSADARDYLFSEVADEVRISASLEELARKFGLVTERNMRSRDHLVRRFAARVLHLPSDIVLS